MNEKKHYKGKNFTMDWDGESKIVSITVSGNHDKEDAKELSGKFAEFLSDYKAGPFKILVNGLDSCRSDFESRKIHADFIKKNFKHRPGAVALCSSSLFIKMIGKFIITITPNAKLKVFDNIEEGLKWLEEVKI
jgi:hypothetical protein